MIQIGQVRYYKKVIFGKIEAEKRKAQRRGGVSAMLVMDIETEGNPKGF